MYIKFYTISERYDEYEKSIRSLVENLRTQLSKIGENPDRVKLTIVKVKPDTANETAKYINEKEEKKIPPQLRYLISALKQDGIMMLPAMVMNNKKIFEGEPLSMDQITSIILNEAKAEFNMDIQIPSQQQQQPLPPPPPPSPPQHQLPQLPPPPQPQPQSPLRQAEVEGAFRGVVVAGFKLVMGRPDDCNDCIYYGANRGLCLLFGFKVKDPIHPPCKAPGLN